MVSFASAVRSILEASVRVLTPIFTCCYSRATSRWDMGINVSQTWDDMRDGHFTSRCAPVPGCGSTAGVAFSKLYCGSTAWPASHCNPQTIPCCYSIAWTAVALLQHHLQHHHHHHHCRHRLPVFIFSLLHPSDLLLDGAMDPFTIIYVAWEAQQSSWVVVVVVGRSSVHSWRRHHLKQSHIKKAG